VLLEPASLKNCSLMELTALNGTTVFPHQVNTGYLLLATLTNEVSRFNRRRAGRVLRWAWVPPPAT